VSPASIQTRIGSLSMRERKYTQVSLEQEPSRAHCLDHLGRQIAKPPPFEMTALAPGFD
jgi:hypothetical protein